MNKYLIFYLQDIRQGAGSDALHIQTKRTHRQAVAST